MGQNIAKSAEVQMNRYCFKSSKFKIEANEDEYTNPGIYGKNFANYLAKELSALGYKIKDIVPEDWGWCIVLEKNICVACNGQYYNNHIIWSCFCEIKNSILKKLFKKSNLKMLKKLDSDIYKIISSNFTLIECL